MAIDAATSLGSDFAGVLTPEDSAPIFENAARQSVVQRLVPQVPLSYNGRRIPVVTDKPTASWVGEGAEKPKTSGGMDMRYMEPHKLASIVVVSAELVRANPGNYMSLIRDQLAEAFASAFDSAALHNTESPFDTAVSQTSKTQALGESGQAQGSVYADLNDALGQLVRAQKKLTGWALDTVTEPILNAAVDLNGRPLFIEAPYEDPNVTLRPGRLLGRSAFIGEGVSGPNNVVGFGGDWSKARWGVIGGINYDVSQEASVTIGGQLTSLWERNLVAVRAEAEYGFVVGDTDAFVTLTSTEAPASTEGNL